MSLLKWLSAESQLLYTHKEHRKYKSINTVETTVSLQVTAIYLIQQQQQQSQETRLMAVNPGELAPETICSYSSSISITTVSLQFPLFISLYLLQSIASLSFKR